MPPCNQSVDSVLTVVHTGLLACTACGIFPDQGSHLHPLHWQADSQPSDHQGSPGQCISQLCYCNTRFQKVTGFQEQMFISCSCHTGLPFRLQVPACSHSRSSICLDRLFLWPRQKQGAARTPGIDFKAFPLRWLVSHLHSVCCNKFHG